MGSNEFNYVVIGQRGKKPIYEGVYDEGTVVKTISQFEAGQYYHMLKIGEVKAKNGSLFFSRESGAGSDFKEGTTSRGSFNVFAGAEIKGLLKVLEAIKNE